MSNELVRARITGTGSCLPEKVLSNADLEKMVDTTDEWITVRTGIKERRIAAENEHTSTLATEASRRALEMAGVAPEDVDMIILGTVTPDFPFPATACIVQHELGAKNAVAFDISAACSGFIYGLSIAEKYIRCNAAKRVLVIGAEVFSRIIDWSDRNTCIIFGDGAGAALVEATDQDNGILSTHMFTDGEYWETLYSPGCGVRNPASNPKTIEEKLYYMKMDGNEVYKHAVRSMYEAAKVALESNQLTTSDISLLITHQANIRIIEGLGKRMKMPTDKVFVNIDKVGNTSAASIPIALDEVNRNGLIKQGDTLLLDAFGGGYTYGSALIRW